MDENDLRRAIESVRRGTLPRRTFVTRLAALGIGAPMAWLLLADAGVAQPSAAPPYKPTRRGGGGLLKGLLWQAPTLLNPHFASGTKDAFGTPDELGEWTATIAGPVTHVWIEGKGHDLKGADERIAGVVAEWLSGR